MIRTLGVIGALSALLSAAPLWAQTGERILDYRVEIDIADDGHLDVTEDITVRAEMNRIRRGIYRDFPTRYRDRFGNNVVVDLDVLGVERDGAAEPWFTERLANGVRINTGDDDFLPRFPADYRFTLRYRTTRQLGFFADHDELYYNAIGTGWSFPIDAATVAVRLPEPVPVDDLAVEAYTGPQGARGRSYSASVVGPGIAQWTLTAPLSPGEGLTIVLSFPKGVVSEPSAARRAGWLLADNRGVLVAIGGFGLLLLYAVRRWDRVGRDPRAGIIIARYFPPAGRSPAELRYLRRRRYDMRCFTADLLAAAVHGDVRLEREDRLLRRDRWRLFRDRGHGVPLPTAAGLVERLLPGNASSIEFARKNASRLQRARQAHASSLQSRLAGSHYSRNAGSIGVAAALAVVTGLLAFAVADGGGIAAIVVVCLLMAASVAVFATLVYAPTAEGRKLLDETEGLRLYLSVAERDELAELSAPAAQAPAPAMASAPDSPAAAASPTSATDSQPHRERPPPLDAARYEALLPYAVALDVEEAWTRKFTAAVGAAAAAAATLGITWYRGGHVDDIGRLARDVGSGLNASIASAATPPGSASGAGGGGSSGGGGGGGGGGGR